MFIPVTTAWLLLESWMDDTAYRYGGRVKVNSSLCFFFYLSNKPLRLIGGADI
jgi:hypothetical protein